MPKGTGACAGIGFAQVLLWQAPVKTETHPRKNVQPESELARFEKALRTTHGKNNAVRQRTARRFGDSEAAIFDAYDMMLRDEEGLITPVRDCIVEGPNTAEYAVTSRFNELAEQFLQLDSEYMRQRAEDIYALRDQLLREMAGVSPTNAAHLDGPTVVVAHTLSPTEIANMDLSRLEGIVCESGGYSSHTAIIARTLGVPAVVGALDILPRIQNGDIVGLDGETGDIWINPGRKEIEILRKRRAAMAEKQQITQLYKGMPTITRDGHRVELSANIGQLDEIETAIHCDAEAIGMLRTELMHVNRMPMAGEDEQYLSYRHALESMSGKAVTVRTFDDGGSNTVLAIKNSPDEANPVLGFRGIRMSLGRPNFFTTQLRALLRASAYGDIKILLPMVSTVQELQTAQQMLEETKMELRREQIAFDDKTPVGVLVQTPAAALEAAALAAHCDFFYIGINDLLQFTLAIDRTNPQLAYLYHLFHPAMLRLIKTVTDAAHEHGLPCYLCGEVPGLEQMLPILMGIGLDGFSMNPSLVLGARRVLNSSAYLDCYRLAQGALAAEDWEEVRQLAEDFSAGQQRNNSKKEIGQRFLRRA